MSWQESNVALWIIAHQTEQDDFAFLPLKIVHGSYFDFFHFVVSLFSLLVRQRSHLP